MSRSALVSSAAAAALVAVAVAAGTGGPSVAGAAAPFSVTKSQFTSVKKTSALALKTSRANTRAIAALQGPAASVAGTPGPKGDPGPAGGFDPSTVSRVVGDPVNASPLALYTAASVACPAGAIAISGGWYLDASADQGQLHVARSYPSASLGSWSFRFKYTGASAQSVTPYAVCAGA